MPTWLIIANGPIGRFALALMVLGLLRLALLTVWDIIHALRSSHNRSVPYRKIFSTTLKWLVPFNRLHRAHGVYSYASVGLHIGVLLAGLFLSNHIDILTTITGLSWPALAKPLLDGLTLIAILGGLTLLFYRIYSPQSRVLSKSMDYIMLALILNIFISGFIAGRAWNPIPYNQLMLFHVLNGVVVLATAPFTKIAHCVLFPLIRLGSEIAWHMPAQAGERVVKALHGPEGRKI